MRARGQGAVCGASSKKAVTGLFPSRRRPPANGLTPSPSAHTHCICALCGGTRAHLGPWTYRGVEALRVGGCYDPLARLAHIGYSSVGAGRAASTRPPARPLPRRPCREAGVMTPPGPAHADGLQPGRGPLWCLPPPPSP